MESVSCLIVSISELFWSNFIPPFSKGGLGGFGITFRTPPKSPLSKGGLYALLILVEPLIYLTLIFPFKY
jgi:hypothetical protein